MSGITIKSIKDFKIYPAVKVLPRVCERPEHMTTHDTLGLRCFNAEGPEFKSGGEIRKHMCVFRHDHYGTLHYAVVFDNDGIPTWYEWGWASA
jgi:hypothetical protein